MLEVLVPKMEYHCLGEPFRNIKENEQGKIEITSYALVPDYKEAIDYYLDDHPANVQNLAYQRAPASDKIKTAYTYLWKSFQSEVIEKATKLELQQLLPFFKDFKQYVRHYQSIIKWIADEQQKALKKPNSKHGQEFVKWMDEIDHIVSLLACLGSVCQIISQGTELIATRLQMLNVDASKLSSDIELNDSNYPTDEQDQADSKEASQLEPAANKHGLTKRQLILIYCYEEKLQLTKKNKNYNDYIMFASPRKRLAYFNNSQSKLKPLIIDIEKVLPHLTERARVQAQKELTTLKSRLNNSELA